MRSPLPHLAAATVVVLASACGSGSNGQQAASQDAAIADPCSLLTPSEVGEALGTSR